MNSLISAAAESGVLSGASMTAISIHDVGSAIQGSLGLDIEVQASEVTHVVMLIDDSGSIANAYVGGSRRDNSDVVCQGHNEVIGALRGAKARDGIFVTTALLNGRIVNAFQHVDSAALLDKGNYSADGGTPLYDQTIVTVAAAVAKAQQMSDNGVPCRTILLIVSDGEDVHSRSKAKDARAVVADVLATEQYVVAGMGIDGSTSIDFRSIFRSMGIEDRWIMVPGSDPKEIRKAFVLFSQSAKQASQQAGSLSGLGGFGS